MEKTIRLQNYITECGICSRRKAAEIIEAGQVEVNKKIVTVPGFRVTGDEEIRLNGQAIKPIKEKVYIALNKPIKYICSNSDENGRRLAIDLIDQKYRKGLHNVGRLDYMSEGLILFTNDGDFTNKVTHPSFLVEKEYEIETVDKVSEEILKNFKKGFIINEERYKINLYKILNSCKVRIVLNEGKNREIRKLFAETNIRIRTLKRIRIANILLNDLKPGEYRILSQDEIKQITGNL
ncbi:MAG: rRNA pseudouridine synthase [Spirochaetales bacterium]|nr:rRNA pseudouridine synthase [Spirochaetales bacterium]